MVNGMITIYAKKLNPALKIIRMMEIGKRG